MKASSRIFVFTFFEFFNKGIPFLLLPILTRYMTPEEYGNIATFLILMSFSAIFIGLSGHGAIDANYYRLAKIRLAKYISNVIIVLFSSFLLLFFLVVVFHEEIFQWMGISFGWQVLALTVALSQFVTVINLTLWVIEKKPVNYGLYQSAQTLIFASLSLLTVVVLNKNWIGHLSALSFSDISFGFISLLFLKKRGYLKFKFRRLYTKDFLLFGLPMLPHQLGDWFRNQGDKLIVLTFIGSSGIGLFTVGQQISMVMLILITSLNRALYPSLFNILSMNPSLEDKKKVVFFTYIIAAVITVIAALGVTLMPFLYTYIIGESFQSAMFLTQLIIIAMVFDAYYYLVVNYIFYAKKTRVLAKITFSVALFHVLSSIILVGGLSLEYYYIAYSMILSSFIQFFLVWLYADKVCSMPWLTFYKNEFGK